MDRTVFNALRALPVVILMTAAAGAAAETAQHEGRHPPQQHGGMTEDKDGHAMRGFYGPYPMSREASGTAWAPDSSPMQGARTQYGAWHLMAQAYANLIYDYQGGKRGDEKAFSESMMMVMAQRPLGQGTFGLRTMFSLDALMGKSGYPLLLQTGETADGRRPLIDRQHPHDLLMELAASYSRPLGENSAVFGYIGYPGEPALGPPTFMHRFSGMDNPEAPLGHHWLDSTHVTFGVATLGYVRKDWKAEVSAFNGQEPDQKRWNFEEPRINSVSGRVSWNPASDWSLQISHGRLDSPEQLEPGVDQNRTTASVAYNRAFGENNNWQTTLAWGRNGKDPGATTDALLLESAVRLEDRHTFFGRAEYTEKDELFPAPHPLAGQTFEVGKLSLGYIRDIALSKNVTLGLGGLGSVYAIPDRIAPFYGDTPVSFMLIARMKLN